MSPSAHSPTTRVAAPESVEHLDAVVLGLDGDVTRRPESAWAVAEALARRRPLHVLFAHHLDQRVLPGTSSADRYLRQELRDHAHRWLDACVERIAQRWPSVEVSGALVEGRAAPALCAATRTARITVLGSHREPAAVSAMLGSVAASVVTHAHGPVVVVRPSTAGTAARTPGSGAVVAGVDPDGDAEDVLAFAFESPGGALAADVTGPDVSPINRDTTGLDGSPASDHERCAPAVVTSAAGSSRRECRLTLSAPVRAAPANTS